MTHRGEMVQCSELFIVEGQSAARTLQQAIRKDTQKVLAVQGKLINAEKATRARVLANSECKKIINTLGCGVEGECNPFAPGIPQVLIVCDPDIDGLHSRILLLAFFNRFLNPLLKSGLVSVIKLPLYKVSGELGKPARYFWTEDQHAEHLECVNSDTTTITTRFKGLAQYSIDECVNFVINPETRKQAPGNSGNT